MGKKSTAAGVGIEIVSGKMTMITNDWENREFLNVITDKIEKMAKILAKFGNAFLYCSLVILE